MKPEQTLQKQICRWLKIQYPDIYFMCDSSGMRVSIGLRNILKATRSSHAALDLVILEPHKGWAGLIIEFKSKTPIKSNGELKNNKHLKNQQKTMFLLTNKGYKTCYAWEFEQAKTYIEEYLK